MKKAFTPILWLTVIIALWLGLKVLPIKDFSPALSDKLGFLQEQINSSKKTVSDLYNTFIVVSQHTQTEKEILKKELSNKTAQQLIAAIQNDNDKLRTLLQLQKHPRYKLIAAEIVARNAETWFSYLTINKGADAGLAVNQPVIHEDGLVGKIVSVEKNYSTVMTITAPQSKVSVINVKTDDVGIAAGRLHHPLKIEYVANTAAMEIGDTIITSGVSKIFPRGLKVGKIIEVHKEKYAVFQKVAAAPTVPFSKLQYVFILSGYK